MKTIKNKTYSGERPLFAASHLKLDNVTIGTGESALKRTSDIEAVGCRFEGKYPFWHACDMKVDNCLFTPGARAAIWYSKGIKMTNCMVEAPKMFRMMMDIDVENTKFIDGQETLWDCANIRLRDVEIDKCDYLLMHSSHVDIDRYVQRGNYSFQYVTDSVIRNARIYSKDAFWNTVNLTVYDSELHGEYLGWYSKDLTLVNCHISGTQPLCYIKNLTMINCTFDPDCDLVFEESDVKADIVSPITSIKNPRHGYIKAPRVGEIILDKNILPDSDCEIHIK